MYTEPSLCYLLTEEFTIDDDDVVIDPISVSGPRECSETTHVPYWFDGFLEGHEDPNSANDIEEEAQFVSTPGRCGDRCNATAACESWTYYPTEQSINCRLFKDRPARAVVEEEPSTVTAKSGYRIITPFVQGGTAFSSTPIKEVASVSTLEKCRGHCVGEEGCLYWTVILEAPLSDDSLEGISYTCRMYDYTARRMTTNNSLATSGTATNPGSFNLNLKIVEENFVPEVSEAKDIGSCYTECEKAYNCIAFNFDFTAAESPCTKLTLPLMLEEEAARVINYIKAEGFASGEAQRDVVKLVQFTSSTTSTKSQG